MANLKLAKARYYRYRNKPEVKEYYAEKQRERRKGMTPERRREINRKSERKRKLKRYGLTEIQYQTLLTWQNNSCGICETTDSGSRDWHVDHCHATGVVRGILCHHCNLMLGNAKDTIATLLKGAEYLGKFEIK